MVVSVYVTQSTKTNLIAFPIMTLYFATHNFTCKCTIILKFGLLIPLTKEYGLV